MTKLRTDRSAFMFWLGVAVTFGIWYIIGSYSIAKDMNTIMTHYDGKTTKRESLLLMSKESVFSPNSRQRINTELQRRGIGMQIPNSFKYCFQLFTALNLLAEDYNRTGC